MPISMTKRFFIDGEQGPLQAELQEAQADRPVLVMCHPHPLYGGSMHDAVLQTAATSAQTLGLGWLRFNFRGVGDSAGTHLPSAAAPAETADLAAALNWLTTNTSERTFITLGYSFGAYVLCHSVEHANVDQRILVAPPNAVMQCPLDANSSPLDIVYGGADDYVDPSAFTAASEATVHKLTAADHFFSGQHHFLAQTLSRILASQKKSISG